MENLSVLLPSNQSVGRAGDILHFGNPRSRFVTEGLQEDDRKIVFAKLHMGWMSKGLSLCHKL